ncbi:MAG: hypothetical protein ABIW76_21765 [Fibrobacteria bacterium]
MPNAIAGIDPFYRLNPGDRAELLGNGPGWKLSLFLPLEKSSREAKVGSVLLRDLRRSAEAEMEARMIGHIERGILLAPVDALLAEAGKGIFHGEGLAVYASASDGFAKTVILSAPPEASFEIDRNFRLDPLHASLAGKDRFYLLCLSLHAIQLWEGDGLTLKPIDLGALETNIEDALDFEDSDSQVQFRTNSASPSRNKAKGQGSTFFGVGGENHDRKAEFLDFFRIIDKGIASLLTDKDVPLILAGVGYLMPLYREANTYAHLAPFQIPGATHAVGPIEDLHAKTNALMREERHREAVKALFEYRENLVSERTVSGFTDVIPCAHRKLVTHLFIRKDSRQWGTYSPSDGRTEIFSAYRRGAVDLVNLACVKTLAGHGKVYILDAVDMPPDSEIAGLCRT